MTNTKAAPSEELGAARLVSDGSQPQSSDNTSIAENARPDGSSRVLEQAGECPRSNRGHFQPGNTASLKHGGRRSLERPDALAALEVKRDQLGDHLGGNLSALQTDLVIDYARTDVLIESVAANIAAHGIITTKGRTRAAVKLLLSLMDRRLKLATTLGIERRAKPIKTLDEVLNGE